jgi:ribosomal protein S18 acetylase RimI-like enzyme
MNVTIRTMRPSDLDFAAACTAAEGWTGETRHVFEGFYAHDPHGCLIARMGDRRVGICVATSYGASGFIGELIVIPEERGQGIGVRLLEQALAYLESQGAVRVFLDGVVAAVPLYERAGFQRICRSLRFSGPVQPRSDPDVRQMHLQDLPAVQRLDRECFGADRSFFLDRQFSEYPHLCLVLERDGEMVGYVMGKRGSESVSTGPWVVQPGVSSPESLLHALVEIAGGNVALLLGVLESHPRAAACVRAMGLAERENPPWRMRLGGAGNLGAHEACYAIGSPARG